MPTSAEMFRSAQLRELQQTQLPSTAHVPPLEPGVQMTSTPDRDLSALLLASQVLQKQKLEIAQLRQLLMRSLQLQQAAQERRALQIRALRAALAAPPSTVAVPPPLAAPPPLAGTGLAQKHARRGQPGTDVRPSLPPGLDEFVRSSTMYAPKGLHTPGALAASLHQLAAQLGSSSDGSDNGGSRTGASGYEAGASGSDKALGSGSGSDNGGWRTGAQSTTASDTSYKQSKSRAPASGPVPARMRTLVIGKFPRSTSDHALRDAFGLLVGHVNINFCRIAREKSGRSLCYAFVEFADVVAAEKAFDACDKGDLVFLDEEDVAWQLTASRARRAQRPLKSCVTQAATATPDEVCNLMVKL